MPATISAFILAFSTLCWSRVVSGVVSGPTNVRLTSHNMNLVLTWEPPEGVTSGLVYTTEYKSSVGTYSKGCVNISTLECDLTHLNFSRRTSIFEHGTYTGRVQAQLGSELSSWVESNQITLDTHTIIGSPNISLFSNGASIEVSIKDPVFTISSLRNVFPDATYNITYWKDGQNQKAKQINNIRQTRVVLDELDPWAKYCVQVHINTVWNSNPGKPSRILCEKTTSEEQVPWVAAVVTFVVLAMAVALVVVMVMYRRSISHILCPKDALPQHFKEYLLAPPNSTIYLAMRNSPPPEEMYHPISIIADDMTVEEGIPLEVAGTTCSKQPDVTVEER